MINKLKENKKQILELIIIFVITLIFNLICNEITCDEIWNYGFAYNIATGLTPYKDFNMVMTPLYPILGSLFLVLFGKNVVVYHIFNALTCTMIFYYMKKYIPKAYYITYAILLYFALPNYSLFSMLLVYILIDCEVKKRNDYIIGIILGLTFLTKQNIGIYLCIPTLFTKDLKKIMKRILGFIIPIIIFTIYLLYNNILYEFIDYCFLGISSFAKENFVSYKSTLIILIITIIYLIYKYLKTKDITILYLLFFQGLAFPLIDPYHVMLPFIPAFGHFLNNLKLSKKVIQIAFIIFIVCNFSLTIVSFSQSTYQYPNDTNAWKYRKFSNFEIKALNNVVEYVENNDDELYIINMYSYLIKLETNIKIDKYDLLNDGNLGKNGEMKIIKEIDNNCQKKHCTFLMQTKEAYSSKYEFSQYNRDILKYIDNNYQKSGNISGLTIYKNY